MNRLVLAAAAMVAFLPQSAFAQHGGSLPDMTAVSPADVPPPEMTEAPDVTVASALTGSARLAYQSWPAERRRTYDAWPVEYRSYFWKLTPDQQRAWWRMTVEQRAMVFGLTPGQRMAAWQVIEARMKASPAPPPPAERRPAR
jgi:hypothetical protein